MSGSPDTHDERPEEKYEDVSAEDVVDDAVEFFREGTDDPEPVTPPVPERDRDEEPPPPNA